MEIGDWLSPLALSDEIKLPEQTMLRCAQGGLAFLARRARKAKGISAMRTLLRDFVLQQKLFGLT